MKVFRPNSLSRISSGLTAIACAGILVNAILTDNGGNPQSQAHWQKMQDDGRSFVETLNKDSYAKWQSEQDRLDQTITNSVLAPFRNVEKTPAAPAEEPSVFSLIRENADVAPAVSSGTGRVSIIVKKGDTLFAISQRHGLKISELARLNGLEEPYKIKVGDTLYVAR